MSRAFPTQGYYADSIFIRYQNMLTACQNLNVTLLPEFKRIYSGSNEYAQNGSDVVGALNSQAYYLTIAYAASIGAPYPYP
jgi:predicted MFS family arabinose efflux permease